jgi:virginiamycin B lyase
MTAMRIARRATAVGVFSLSALFSVAQAPVQITEFTIGGNPIPLTVGSDGNFWTWFSGTQSVGRMTPNGVATFFQIPFGLGGATPGHCVDGRDGGIWCATFEPPVLRVSVASGAASTFPLAPGSAAADMTLGPDGALWFADPSNNEIGRITTGGVVTEFPLPVVVHPHSITVGPDGALWFSGDVVGRLDTTGGGFNSYILPDPPELSSAIVAGPDGNLWLGVGSSVGLPHRVARVTLAGQATEFPLTNPASSGVLDIVAGPDRAMWFTDEQANEIGRITTSGTLTEFALPQQLSGPVGITVGRDRAIWFTELAGRIGRLSGGPLTPIAVPALTPAMLLLLGVALATCGWLFLRVD